MDDYLKKRAEQLNLGRAVTLLDVQAWLDRDYAGKTRAASLNNDVLQIITPSASVASEIRLRQVELLTYLAAANVKRLQIQIGTL
jgi:hypothetical protein